MAADRRRLAAGGPRRRIEQQAMTDQELAGRPHALYRFFDASGALLYIGITAALPARLARHREDKPWWCNVAEIKVEHFPTRRAVLEAEREAIIRERPVHNKQHNGMVARSSAEVPAEAIRFGIEVGFVVALITDLPTSTKCYVGCVEAVDDYGVRMTLVDWFVGMFVKEDLFVPWAHILGAAVWTEEHSFREEYLARWQNSVHGEPAKAGADDE
jgi:hypothetical protein